MYYPYPNMSTNKLSYTMNVEGEGRIKVSPDVAIISLGVITENKELKTAQKENAQKTNDVISTIKDMGVKESDIKTESYNIYPQYDYVEGKQIFKNYKVVNNLKVILKDIEKTGEVIDAAVDSGANTVNSVNFTVSNPSKYYNDALNIAMANAIEKAQNLANTIRVMVDMVPGKIYEESYSQGCVSDKSLFKVNNDGTPIEAGQLEIIARIKAIFSYRK